MDSPLHPHPAGLPSLRTTVQVYAQHGGKMAQCAVARHRGRTGVHGCPVPILPLPDQAEQLQRHLRLLCCHPAVHAVDAHLVVHLPHRRADVLCQPIPGQLCL